MDQIFSESISCLSSKHRQITLDQPHCSLWWGHWHQWMWGRQLMLFIFIKSLWHSLPWSPYHQTGKKQSGTNGLKGGWKIGWTATTQRVVIGGVKSSWQFNIFVDSLDDSSTLSKPMNGTALEDSRGARKRNLNWPEKALTRSSWSSTRASARPCIWDGNTSCSKEGQAGVQLSGKQLCKGGPGGSW